MFGSTSKGSNMEGLEGLAILDAGLGCSYNKDKEDFPDLQSFGDYEEEKEDISKFEALHQLRVELK